MTKSNRGERVKYPRLTVSLDFKLIGELQMKATEEDRSVSGLVRSLLKRGLAERQDKPALNRGDSGQ
jgi:hypothetical protein